MYLLREGSASTDDPLFLRLPTTAADYKERQLILFPELSVAKWFYQSGIAERSLINWVTESSSCASINDCPSMSIGSSGGAVCNFSINVNIF
jgi:hypothetical protein